MTATIIRRARRMAAAAALLVILAASGRVARADGNYFSPEVDRLFSEGVALVQNERFDEALERFSGIQNLMPDHPLGYFLKAALYQDITSNYRTDRFASEFKTNIERSIALSKKMIDRNDKDPMGYFFLGGSYGYLGLQQKEFGLWFSAFRNGLKGVGQLQKTVEIDPDIYDCYYGIGSYHYWRVIKGRVLKFLGIFKDTREQGIAEIELAAAKGRYARSEASMALTRVYVSEGRIDKAMAVIAEIEKNLERDLYSSWFKAYIFLSDKNWQSALDAFGAVEKLLSEKDFSGPEAYAECYYSQALCLAGLGRRDEALAKVAWIRGNRKRLRRTETVDDLLRNIPDLERSLGKGD